MKKDYSLLRPFDLEAAKHGEPICFSSGAKITRFIDGPDSVGDLVFVVPDGQFYFTREKEIRMAPLAWVEDRPVYRGDVLYNKVGQELTATGEKGGKLIASKFPDSILLEPDFLRWTPTTR